MDQHQQSRYKQFLSARLLLDKDLSPEQAVQHAKEELPKLQAHMRNWVAQQSGKEAEQLSEQEIESYVQANVDEWMQAVEDS